MRSTFRSLLSSLIGIGAFFALGGMAHASDRIQWAGPFPVTILEIKDGDTAQIAVRGSCPFGCITVNKSHVIAVRLRGIDAPEIHACKTSVSNSCALCPQELALAKQAKARVLDLLPPGAAARVVSLSPDKYRGRVVGDLQVFQAGKWRSLSATLVNEQLAIPYGGKTKTKPWCEATK